VLAVLSGDDVILCQVTSQPSLDPLAIELTQADFASGSLQRASYARPGRLFSADRRIVLYRAGRLETNATEIVLNAVARLFHPVQHA
jgi:mRNA interferase MazF